MKACWRVSVATVVSVAAGAIVVCAGSAAPVVLRVRVTDRARVPPTVLNLAEIQAAALYQQIGVSVVWASPTAGSGVPDPDLVVSILSARTMRPRPRSADTFGVARVSLLHPVGGMAYVFYDRIDALMRRMQGDTSCLLGYVIAHEVGHLLLPALPHTSHGIMQRHLSAREMDPGHANLIRFSRGQGERIRARVGALQRPAAAAEPTRADHR